MVNSFPGGVGMSWKEDTVARDTRRSMEGECDDVTGVLVADVGRSSKKSSVLMSSFGIGSDREVPFERDMSLITFGRVFGFARFVISSVASTNSSSLSSDVCDISSGVATTFVVLFVVSV